MKRRSFLVILGLLIGLYLVTLGVKAAVANEYVIFIQKNDLQRTLYIAKDDGSALQAITSGKGINIFSIGKHLLVFNNRQLLEYHPEQKKAQLITTFDQDVDFCYAFAMKPAGPDQALVVTGNEYSSFLHWYVLEFSDGSLRKIDPPFDSLPSGKPEFYSPDENAEAVIRESSLSTHYDMQIKEKTDGKSQTLWSLPKDMTVLPAPPVWAPNSRWLAFYGKKMRSNTSFSGSYSLYVFNLDKKELVLVQDQLFEIADYNKVEMGEFRPDWSDDSRYLIVEYQPYGLPTESSVLKYDINSGKKVYLNDSRGEKQYPEWSPSGASIVFLSSREGKGLQVYAMDAFGLKVTRLSPLEGVTEWAKWQQF